MLKQKIHRIPILDQKSKVIGFGLDPRALPAAPAPALCDKNLHKPYFWFHNPIDTSQKKKMEISIDSTPFDLDFHPSNQLVATGLINGRLHLYRYSEESQLQKMTEHRVHRESCRAVRFVNSGSAILTASSDCSILAIDVETGKAITRMKNAHGAAVNKIVNLTESTIASGDDTGCIKVWDTRQCVCCNTFEAQEDRVSEATFISDMTYVPDTTQLVATCGDGTLSVCSLRKNMVQYTSEFVDDALLSVVIMKHGKKVVCGTESGALLLYSWGSFEDYSGRFRVHTQPVEALLKLDEDTLISASDDGIIRLVGILPNKIIQPLAEHSEEPIEALAFSHDRKYLGSVSHDKTLKLWDLQELLDGKPDDARTSTASSSGRVESDSDDDAMDTDQPVQAKNKGKKVVESQNSFFADMDD